jgi:hypothetical protein
VHASAAPDSRPNRPDGPVETHLHDVENRRRKIPVDAGALRDIGDAMPRASTGWPNTSTSPESRGTMPRQALSKVDLPAPFGPMMAVMAPVGEGRVDRKHRGLLA